MSGGGGDFPHLSRPALGPNQPPVQWVPALFRGKERPMRDADSSPPFSAVVVKGYSYTFTPSMGCTACTEPQCLYKGAIYLYIFTMQICIQKFLDKITVRIFQNYSDINCFVQVTLIC
jgi:hypothetical protein